MAPTTGTVVTYATNTHNYDDLEVAPNGDFIAAFVAANRDDITIARYNHGTQS
ncbi:MAG: hypothetical protein N4A70_06435 [Pelagimonas sp.]|jgi:hypothetical protein|nr:hypothetical protein [Pelagimonas sp.]